MRQYNISKLLGGMKAAVRWKFILLQAYLKKQENNLTLLHLKEREKEKQKQPKVSKRKKK